MKKTVLGLLAFVTLLFSCEKEKTSSVEIFDESSIEENNQVKYCTDSSLNILNCVINDTVKYYLDGIRVNPGTFDPADDELYILIDGDSLSNGDAEVNIRAFTTYNDYEDFGINNGVPIDMIVEFEAQILEFVEDSGYITEFETYGDVPQDYYDFEANLYSRLLGENQDRSPIWLYQDYSGGSSTVSVLGYKPFFIASQWNNAVSRYNHWASLLYGWVSVYDKTFYRDRMAIITAWGWQYILFDSNFGLLFLNDKMTSVAAS